MKAWFSRVQRCGLGRSLQHEGSNSTPGQYILDSQTDDSAPLRREVIGVRL